jgi:hypothetical protein
MSVECWCNDADRDRDRDKATELLGQKPVLDQTFHQITQESP